MRVFVTGITGTLGAALCDLHLSQGDQVFGCARNESKSVDWLSKFGKRATLFLGNYVGLTDPKTDMHRTLATCDRLYHAAAIKHVDIAEANPDEAFKQNVVGTNALALTCQQLGVPFVFISSDKACLPQSVYGATKLMGETIAVRRGGAAVRLGNLVGSSGSVFELWKRQYSAGKAIRLTDPEMTRYFIPVAEAAQFCASHAQFGKVVVPANMKAARMGEVAEKVNDEIEVVGRRPGETRHQWIVAPGDLVTFRGDTAIIGEGYALLDGANSETAPRWDVDELLETAGVSAVGGGGVSVLNGDYPINKRDLFSKLAFFPDDPNDGYVTHTLSNGERVAWDGKDHWIHQNKIGVPEWEAFERTIYPPPRSHYMVSLLLYTIDPQYPLKNAEAVA